MSENRMLVVIALLSSLVLCTAQISVNLSSAELPSTVNIPIDASSTEVVPPVMPAKLTTKRTTTTMPTTTTSSTTTTTTTPNPTTTTTTKTTTSTTETPTTTSTTTAAPITTPTPTPTPTPHPTPNPEPDVLIINSTCILAKMAVQLNFTYETKDNQLAYSLYNIPKSVFVGDTLCNITVERIQIHWGLSTNQHIMDLQFDSDNKTSNLTMMMFTLPLTEQEFPNARKNQTIQLIHRGFDFIAPLQMSYHCTRPQMFNLTTTLDKNETVGTAKFHDVQVEAFRGAKATGFSEARDCDGIDTFDGVSIAVGVSLASLIIIVLISYLCARRRSTSRGYMSF